ncbi:SHOCT domain-containing protein [Flavobacterium sp. F-380]|uniref:SHOCT domain-containing protein n=1 Tax=Flavobacterium kayseriense TaxID=2764714 RepID=A0ABR7J5C2_9FLAO|nr:SHOCT domain-containing protein [Flavobacterium kayseriense]MBC5840740.1 SHOCT domain-containing protein [Flavobacterium kayseriense]MBC5846590.1 SHOCT domain-containing protein [Flavobacterium kayseriense]
MKKITLLLLFVSSFVNAQQRVSEYKASNGVTYKEGDTIQLGRGSGLQGTFVYLKIAGWMAGSTTQIGSAYGGLNVEIKKIKKATFKGGDKVFFVVGGGNITNYSLEIEEAIATCEVKECTASQTTVVSKSDKYDQLKKLKDLLADGTISQEEFDSEKKKLLNE